MFIDNVANKTPVGHYRQQRTEHRGAVNFFNERPAIRSQHNHDRQDQLKLSEAAKSSATEAKILDLEKQPDAEHSLNIQIIQSMFKAITGEDLQLFAPQALEGQAEQVSVQQPSQAPNQTDTRDTGSVYRQSLSYFEAQTFTFDAKGSINTKDGQSVSFSVSLSMSRIFYAETDTTLRTTEAANAEPLIVNYAGSAAELTATHFEFVLDANGSQGQINRSGTQTPGAIPEQTGDSLESRGAATDHIESPAIKETKNNRLIGLANAIYQQLRIWQRHADGSQQLLALGEKNIGALYLGHLTNPLQSKTEQNSPVLSEVADSSMSLQQNTRTETVQQINFTA
jgi:hypothetical protein